MSDTEGTEASAEVDGAMGRVGQLERELRAVKAELEVKNEYVAFLEQELDGALALVPVLEAKTAYTESLPSVRFKSWVSGLRPKPRG
jgi:hypothetical protein